VVDSILAFLSALRVFFRSPSDIALEVLALRQPVAVLKRQRPQIANMGYSGLIEGEPLHILFVSASLAMADC
jgi:hypothetical protein